MNIDELEKLIHGDVSKRFQEYKDSQAPPQPPATVVNTTAELLAALQTGGNIELAAGVEEFFNPTGFILPSGTKLTAPSGGTIRADNQPALRVKPGSHDIIIEGMTCLSKFSGGVIQLGDNVATTQGTADEVPKTIMVRNVTIPTHRGKRGIEVNAAEVLIKDCIIEDVYAASAQDSQAIGVLNTYGNITIEGGRLSAGSENIMLGGDTMKVPGQIINDVIIRNVHLFKPLSWQTDGVNRAVKNLLELKAGHNVQILNCTLDGSWRAAQDGYAFVITPRNAQSVVNVTLDGCTAINCGGAVNIMGVDYNLLPPEPTNNLVIKNCTFTVDKAKFGGRGILALITNNTKAVSFENVTFSGDGNALIQSESREPQGPCTITGGTMTYLKYGVAMPGSMYGDPLPPDSTYYQQRLVVDIRNNTFTGTPSTDMNRFKKNFPNNVYPVAQ